MSETLDVLEDRVRVQSRRAAFFCLPLYASLAFLLGEMYLWESFVPGLAFGLLVVGLAVAALPMTRHQRAKSALERAKKKAHFAELMSAFEPDSIAQAGKAAPKLPSSPQHVTKV